VVNPAPVSYSRVAHPSIVLPDPAAEASTMRSIVHSSLVPGALVTGMLLLPATPAALAGGCPHCVDYGLQPSGDPLGTLDLTDEPFDLDLRGNVVYLAISNYQNLGVHELVTVDVSDPTSPLLLDTADSPGGHRSVDVEGDHAFVTFPDLARFDISDPSAIEMDGFLDFGVFPGETAGHIEVEGDLAFVITDLEGQSAEKLRIIDVSGDPAFLGSVTFSYHLNDLAVRGAYVYAVGFLGVHVVDVSDPLHPVHLGTISMENQVTDIELVGDIALVSVFERPLTLLDISDPASPEVIGAGPSLATIVAAGDLVYALHASSLALYDLSDQTTLRPVGSLGGVFAHFFDVDGCNLATVNPHIGDELRMFPTHCAATTAAPEHANPGVGHPMAQGIPNPFRGEVRLEYELPGSGPGEIAIYDAAGRLVRRLDLEPTRSGDGPGPRSAVWDGRDGRGRRSVPGTYFYRVAAGDRSVIGQLTLLR